MFLLPHYSPTPRDPSLLVLTFHIDPLLVTATTDGPHTPSTLPIRRITFVGQAEERVGEESRSKLELFAFRMLQSVGPELVTIDGERGG